MNERIAELWETDEYTWLEVAEIINREFTADLSDDACRSRYRRYKKRDKNTGDSNTVSVKLGKKVVLNGDDIIQQAIAESGINTDAWEPYSGKVSVYENYQDGEPVQTAAVKFNIRKKANPDLLEQLAEIQRILDQKSNIELVPKNRQKYNYDGALFVPCIFDLHLEKRGLHDDRDVVQDYIDTLFELSEQATAIAEIGRILFIVGNDFGNFDNLQGSTTKGTPQDNKYNYHRGVDTRCKLVLGAIDYLLNIAPVDVVVVPGNHDLATSYWLGKIIDYYYKNNNNVNVDCDFGYRKYYQWGTNMLLLAHGQEEKDKSLPALMATEKPIMYSESTYKEALMGHYHSYKGVYIPVNEESGIYIRYMPSLSVDDNWHTMKGFLGNNRGGIGLLYDKKRGWLCEFPAFIREKVVL